MTDSSEARRRRDARPVRAASRGFSLVELLVALALLSGLMVIALPAFREQIARARRSALQAVLLDDAGYMQRYYAAHASYLDDPPPVPTWSTSPRTGPPDYLVHVEVSADAPMRFRLVAVRAGAMRGDRCGDFTYDELGRRELLPGTAAAGVDAPACWR